MTRGYKVFNPDFTCKGFQYEVGKTYEHTGDLGVCSSGFHFCEKLIDCYEYYSFQEENKIAEVIAHGKVLSDGKKSVTDKIEIVKEITWSECLNLVNHGKDNTGYRNTGNRNTGNWNTGDWNTTKYSSGVFCTEIPKVLIFNKPSNWTLDDWRGSDARHLLNQIQTVFWTDSSDMTPQEKELHPEHETTGGFLKTVHLVEAAEKWWSELSDKEKQIIRDIPNFDPDKFYAITGVRA